MGRIVVDVRTGESVVDESFVKEDFRPPPPTSEEKDDMAANAAESFLDNSLPTRALGLVIADVIERAYGVSQAQARAQVRQRFIQYYRQLLG